MPNIRTDFIFERARHLIRQGQTEAAAISRLLDDFLADVDGPRLSNDEQTRLLSSLRELSERSNAEADILMARIADSRDTLLAKLHFHFSQQPSDQAAHWAAEITRVLGAQPAPAPAVEDRWVMLLSTGGENPQLDVLLPFIAEQFAVAPIRHVIIGRDGVHERARFELHFPGQLDEDELAQEASMLCKMVIEDEDFGCPDFVVDDLCMETVKA